MSPHLLFNGGKMFYLNKKMKEFGTIRVSIVGLGLMGGSLLDQLLRLEGFRPTIVAARDKNRIIKKLESLNISENDYVFTDDIVEAISAYERNLLVATTNIELSTMRIFADCVCDATGSVELGCDITVKALNNKVHVVSLNVEMDATVGPILNKIAKDNNVVYSGSYGDEPGSIIELYEFAKFSGFEVLHLGKGKNNKLNNYATNEMLRDEAISKGLSPRMLTSFVDGTNTMIELNAVCNATGFKPDVDGCHFIESSPKDLVDNFKLKEDGGVFNKTGTVDFVKGIHPGVFAIVKPCSEIMNYEMKFLQMGEGPNYSIYRPYHLTSIETPISIAKAVVLEESSIAPIEGAPFAETVAVAKRDIKKGEKIEGIGSDMIFGTLVDVDKNRSEDLVPIGLITEKTIAKEDIKKGVLICYNMIELDYNSSVIKLKSLQNNLTKEL